MTENRVSEGTRLNEIQLPPKREDSREQRFKPPGWLVIVVLAILAIGMVVTLSLTSSSNKDSAEQTKSEAITVFDQIQQACSAKTVPEQFMRVCSSTPGARERVEAAAPGAPGATGDQGPQGIPGVPGADGTNGLNGTAGSPGAAGSSGSRGLPGSSGADGVGVPGAPGADGASITGPAGAAGKDGAPGVAGPPGATGATGATGVQGPKGDDGAPGGFPSSYTISHADGRTELCTRNDSPPPDYTCSFTS